MKPHKIVKLYAWICTEPDGEHGIPAFNLNGAVMPLIGSDLERMESLRPYAEMAHREHGYPVELVEFSTRTVLETLGNAGLH